jgi:hypothetical protein
LAGVLDQKLEEIAMRFDVPLQKVRDVCLSNRKQPTSNASTAQLLFLNHRCFIRSEIPERVGKSPKQLMTGEAHPHWLELLGFQRFQRA